MHIATQALRAAEARRIGALPDEALINHNELATLLGVHRNTVGSLARRGLLPPALRFGENGRRRWRMQEVRALLVR